MYSLETFVAGKGGEDVVAEQEVKKWFAKIDPRDKQYLRFTHVVLDLNRSLHQLRRTAKTPVVVAREHALQNSLKTHVRA